MPDQEGQAPPKKSNGHGGARAGAGRPRGPLPPPIRDQARDLVVMAFQSGQIGHELRLQAAIALMLEPEYLGPAVDRTGARYMARLRAMTRVEITRTPTFREAIRALNASLDAAEAVPAGDGPAPGPGG